MRKQAAIILTILVMFNLLSGCNLPSTSTEQPADQEAAIQTAAALTVAAFATELAPNTTEIPTQAIQPSVTPQSPTQQPFAATFTPVPSATSVPPTSQPKPCDRAEFVTDVTVADGTSFEPGTTFVKTWRLRNTGTCTWTTSYKVVFESGAAMSGPASKNLTDSVAPGQTIDISVTLKAPNTAGTYQGYWKLQNASGATFGLGSNADKTFWVKITVGKTALPFAVTSANITTDDPDVTSSDCPYEFTFTAKITVTAAGTVKYHVERSDGGKGSVKTLKFDSAGSQTVNFNWTFGEPGNTYSDWVRLYIDEPNHQFFPKANIKLTCN